MPIRWTAPEALEEYKFTTASDVWSFGVLMYEIWSKGATPYGDIPNLPAVQAKVLSGYRLPCPEGCPLLVYAIMTQCWQTDPTSRPTFDELLSQLNDLKDNEAVDLLGSPTVQPKPTPVSAAPRATRASGPTIASKVIRTPDTSSNDEPSAPSESTSVPRTSRVSSVPMSIISSYPTSTDGALNDPTHTSGECAHKLHRAHITHAFLA